MLRKLAKPPTKTCSTTPYPGMAMAVVDTAGPPPNCRNLRAKDRSSRRALAWLCAVTERLPLRNPRRCLPLAEEGINTEASTSSGLRSSTRERQQERKRATNFMVMLVATPIVSTPSKSDVDDASYRTYRYDTCHDR